MKFFTALAGGLVLLAGSARRRRGPTMAGIDVEIPYADAPAAVAGRLASPDQAGPHQDMAPACCHRQKSIPCCATPNFSPLGIPRLRGFVYTIAALDRDGLADGW